MPRGRDSRYDSSRLVGRPVPNLTAPYRQFAGVTGTPHPNDSLEEVSQEGAFNLVDQGSSRVDAFNRTLQTFGVHAATDVFQKLQSAEALTGP